MDNWIQLGTILATAGIDSEMQDTYGFEAFCNRCVARHYYMDWGDLCEEDKKLNDLAVKTGDRILSAYKIPKDLRIGYADKIWIITEADRSRTTVLFPDEY